MERYKTNDINLAAYLNVLGYDMNTERNGSTVTFIFEDNSIIEEETDRLRFAVGVYEDNTVVSCSVIDFINSQQKIIMLVYLLQTDIRTRGWIKKKK